MFAVEARVLIGWLVQSIFASQPIRTRASKSNNFVFVVIYLFRKRLYKNYIYNLILIKTTPKCPLRPSVHYAQAHYAQVSLRPSVHYAQVFTTPKCSLRPSVHYAQVSTTQSTPQVSTTPKCPLRTSF